MSKRTGKQRIRQWISVLLIGVFAFYSGVMLFDFEGAVFCVGEDGHFAIEAVEANQHVALVYSATGVPQYTGAVVVDDSCRDVPLEPSLVSLLAPVKFKWDYSSAAGHAIWLPFLQSQSSKIQWINRTQSFAARSLQQILRSVILLI